MERSRENVVEWEYRVTNKSWSYREAVEWEIEVRVEWGYCRECHGVGKEVRHGSHDVCVGSDIIVTS